MSMKRESCEVFSDAVGDAQLRLYSVHLYSIEMYVLTSNDPGGPQLGVVVHSNAALDWIPIMPIPKLEAVCLPCLP